MSNLKKIASRYKVLLKKADVDYARIGYDYLNNFEGMDHQALVAMAKGELFNLQELEGDFEGKPELAQKYQEVLSKKSDLLMQAAKAMVPLDKEAHAILNQAFESDDPISEWEEYYPMLKEQQEG